MVGTKLQKNEVLRKGPTYKLIFTLIVSGILLSGCVSTKYVPEGEYLLNKVSLHYTDKHDKIQSLKKNIRQKPNTKVLGLFRVQLGFYNLSGPKDKKINTWLRKMGEEPVVYSDFTTERSVSQLRSYLNNHGYFDAVVSDSVSFKKRKARVDYFVTPGERTFVRSLDFTDKRNIVENSLPDSADLSQLRYSDTASSLLQVGMPLDVDILEKERDRISTKYRESGYYAFAPSYIRYVADTINVHDSPQEAELITVVVIPPADTTAEVLYRIGEINVNMDFDQLLSLNESDSTVYDTFEYDGVNFSYSGDLKLKPKVIIRCLGFATGDIYNSQYVSATYSRLQALGVFRYVNILFKEREGGILDCEVQLTPAKRQSYSIFIEGTNNSGNIGFGGNLTYGHHNLFHGAEEFSAKVWGALKKERMKEDNFFSTVEYGVELKLETPQFWLPFRLHREFGKNTAPHTATTLSFSSEYTPYYTRAVSTIKYGYWWRHTAKWRLDVNPIDVNYVKMSRVDNEFFASLKNEYIKSAYTSHVVASGNVSATFSDTHTDKDVNYNWLRLNLEGAGNLMRGLSALFNAERSSDSISSYYKLFGVRYAQYVKADADYRFHQAFNANNAFVYRIFLGIAFPYGNMKAMPFEEAYFVGGANDMRGWHARMLGPGSYANDTKYPNSVGDFKLEVNWEYRFRLFWLLEGAIFADAGNVWKINHTDNIPEGELNKNFYKQIAVDCGPGIRLDVNFFLIRVDWGIKLRDPAKERGDRFVLVNNGKWLRNTVLNIAIGYPF